MTIKENIQAWLNEAKVNLEKEYLTRGHKASGNWATQLEDRITETNTGYRAEILGAPYTGIMETGRKPNKKQDADNIRAWVGWAGSTFLKEWVKRKGISANPFAIAYKIAREGITVPNKYNKGNLVSDVITKERIDKLLQNINNAMITDLKSDVIKLWQ